MKKNPKDIKSLQLFQIIRQQYIAQLVESFKQVYRDKNGKEPSRESVQTFIEFLEKETRLIDKMVEMAFQETMDYMKETASINDIAISSSEQPKKKRFDLFSEKLREIIVLPFLIGGLTYAITNKDWIMTGILLVLTVLLALLWWKGKQI